MIKGLRSLSTLFALKVNSKGSCVACLAPDGRFGLCQKCTNSLPANRCQCRLCALPLPFSGDQQVCGQCLKDPPPFSQIVAPWHYRFPVDALIQRYKDSGQRACAKPLLKGLGETVSTMLSRSPEGQPDLLIPAPMHPARRRNRGFNQASDIAEYLSRELNIPWSQAHMIRTRYSPPQRGLNRQDRLANLSGAFQVTKSLPARIALIDDVVTTGATVRQLALTLKQAGAEELQVWALARTPG